MFDSDRARAAVAPFAAAVTAAALVLGCGSGKGGAGSSHGSSSVAATTPASPATTTGSTTAAGTTTPGSTTAVGTATSGVTSTPGAAPSPTPLPAPTGTTVLVVCGLSQEQQAAQGPNTEIVLSDSDPNHLVSVLSQTSPAGVKAVISWGIGGGLNPSYGNATVMIASGVVAPANEVPLTGVSGAWTCDAGLVSQLQTGLAAGGINAVVGLEACVESLSADDTPAAKAALRAQTGADEVDMESHLAAQWAQQNNLPFVALRVVSDDADTALPPAALLPLNSSGNANIGSILGSVLSNPGQIGGLLTAYTDSSNAFNMLTRCHQIFPLGGLR